MGYPGASGLHAIAVSLGGQLGPRTKKAPDAHRGLSGAGTSQKCQEPASAGLCRLIRTKPSVKATNIHSCRNNCTLLRRNFPQPALDLHLTALSIAAAFVIIGALVLYFALWEP
jgi:hypothetical protein